jgi:hypothetical protein
MCHISDITLTADVILDDRYYKPRQHDHSEEEAQDALGQYVVEACKMMVECVGL